MKPNFIYILRSDPYNPYDIYDAVELISTDIKDLLTEDSYCKTGYDQEIIVAINGRGISDGDSIDHHASGIVEHLRQSPPDIYQEHLDEFEYVLSCLSNWIIKKTEFLREKMEREVKENKKLKAERERKEYERLKRKFENGVGS